jgi:hypothetical protein
MVMKESLVPFVDSTETLAPKTARGEPPSMAYGRGIGGLVVIFARRSGVRPVHASVAATALKVLLRAAGLTQAVFSSDDFGG